MSNFYHARLDTHKSVLVSGARFSKQYEFPMLNKVDNKTDRAISFEKSYETKDYSQWVHFYTQGRHFECVWNAPQRYLTRLRRFAGVITPDFSLYRELPLVMQAWNTYRNRAIGFWLQREGVPIIPNVRWGDERTYAFAFEGLSHGGTVAIGSHGTLRNALDRFYFKCGFDVMMACLEPETVVVYGDTPDDIFGEYRAIGCNIITIPCFLRSLRKEVA